MNSGLLNLNGNSIDISTALGMWNSKEYRANNIKNIDVSRYKKSEMTCKFSVLPDGADTIAFNDKYKLDNKKFMQRGICVLNFASSKNPGGGFENGAMAQEEALCQASNLYNILSKHREFYEYNRKNLNKGLYSDGIIFTRNVLFFRNKYKNVEPQLADVITCPAPNFKAARRNGVSETEIENTMYRRIEQIIKVAIANDVRVLVLGAFGCGVFGNNPNKVANIMAKILTTKGYSEYFDEIIFAMNGTTGENVSAFTKVFKKLVK